MQQDFWRNIFPNYYDSGLSLPAFEEQAPDGFFKSSFYLVVNVVKYIKE